MMSVTGQSMAGLSDGDSIMMVAGGASEKDGASMYSGSDVMVVRQGKPNESMIDESNTSMAGLTDMSMGEVKKL